MKLKKDTNKEEILELYKLTKSSELVAEILAEKYEIYNISTSTLARKIRKWLERYSQEGELVPDRKSLPAKVLVFDIETSPLIVYTWSKWQQNIQDDDIIQDWSILCFSAKWLFNNKTISFKMTDDELSEMDDSRLALELWKLLDEADIVIAHNGMKFDIKKCNSKFIENRLGLPSHYQVIDTLLHARKRFAMTSNKLDFLAKKLGLGGKMETPKGMWRDVLSGDVKAYNKMMKYCNQDVKVLEDVYVEMRPYIQPHPNIGLFSEEEGLKCTCCASTNLKDTGRFYNTTVNQFKIFRCNDCRSMMRSRKTALDRKKGDGILSSLPN